MGDRFIRSCYWAMDVYLWALSTIGQYQGTGTCIAVRRKAFDAIGGFREDILVGEDADFIRRLGTAGKVRYERNHVVFASSRRFFIENKYGFAAKTAFWACLRLLRARVSVIPYHWQPYPGLVATLEAAELMKVSAREKMINV